MSLINNPYKQSDPQEQYLEDDFDPETLAWAYICKAHDDGQALDAVEIAEDIYLQEDINLDPSFVDSQVKRFRRRYK